MQNIEFCKVCNGPTGQGPIRTNSSIYVDINGAFFSYHTGDEVGPLCPACWEAMVQLGLIYYD